MRSLRFICGNFRDEAIFSFGLGDVEVDTAGLANGGSVNRKESIDLALGDRVCLPQFGNLSAYDGLKRGSHGIRILGSRWLPDKIGNVDRVKIAVG